jgi:hypothetical protein
VCGSLRNKSTTIEKSEAITEIFEKYEAITQKYGSEKYLNPPSRKKPPI